MANPNNPSSNDTDKKNQDKTPEAPKSAEIAELDDMTLDKVVGGVQLPDDGNGNCGNCNCDLEQV